MSSSQFDILFKSRKMLQKMAQLSLWKMGIYLIYLTAQILILAALLLTTTNMIVHVIIMLLTILTYFAVSFKNPGTYIADPVPNLEDVDNKSKSKVENAKNVTKFNSETKSRKKKDDFSTNSHEDQSRCQNEPEQLGVNQLINDGRGKTKTSIQQKREINEESNDVRLQINQVPISKKEEQDSKPKEIQAVHKEASRIPVSANNLFNAAKAVIGNLAGLVSRKDIEKPLQQQKAKEIVKKDITELQPDKREKSQTKKVAEKRKGMSLADIHRKKRESISVSSMSEREERAGSEIRDQFNINQIRQQFSQPQKIQCRGSKTQIKSLNQKMRQLKRYCRICQIYQPLRVRHCHSCQQCISTFDHHCPWINTCIGEKNKHLFLLYLFTQILQFFVIFIDLARYLATTHQQNGASVGILLISVILFFVLLTILLAFHIYLLSVNLTTWELFRWDRIQYLNVFDKNKIKSPFSKGFKENVKQFWSISRQSERKIWEDQITDEMQKHLLKKGRIPKTELKCEGPQTNRQLFRTQQNV